MEANAFDIGQLSPSCLDALSFADAYRKSLDSSKIHVEHLLMGLYDAKDYSPARTTLRKAGIDRQELVNRLTAVGIKLPSAAPAETVAPVSVMPPLSSHTAQAVEMAFNLSAKSDWGKVKSRHLFAGIFSVPECKVPRALPEVRPHLEELVPEWVNLMPPTEISAKKADWRQTESEQSARIKASSLEDATKSRASFARESVVDLPRPQNPYFTGREDILADIQQALITKDQRAVILVGGPGVGKTEIAVAYVHRHGKDFGSIRWVDASSPELLFENLSAAGNLANKLLEKPAPMVDALIVFDNAPDKSALLDVLSKSVNYQNSRLLITSRGGDWGEFFGPVLHVRNFDPEEAQAFLKRRLGDLDDDPDAAKMVIDQSEGLPLYLEMFCRHIKRRDEPISSQGLNLILPDLAEKVAERIGDVSQIEDLDFIKVQPTAPSGPRAWVETDAIPVIGRLRSDYRPSEYDSLDAKIQAEIMATLLVAKEVRPPFAIGLLGDWGVGKTFFMRLMQEKVTAIAGRDAQADQNFDYVTRAAQIEFNAWHYVDSDLWASLASHIFDGLADQLRYRENKIESVRRRLRRMIDSSKRDQSDAQVAIVAAQEARQKSAVDLAKKQEKRAQLAAQYDSFRLKRIWQAVLKVAPNPDKQEQKDWPDVKKLVQKAEQAARRVGITEAIDNAEEVQRVYTALRDILYRGSGLAMSLAASFTGKGLLYSIPILLVLVALIVGWHWILEQIETYFALSEREVADRLAPLLRLTTVVATPAVWAGKNLRSISSALGYLEKVRDELREPRIELPPPGDDEKDLKDQIEDLDTRIATEQRRIEEADRQIAQAQAEIQRINAGGLVYDFLEERIQDSRYLERLGLISVIRRDFEELGALLEDWKNHNKEIDGEKSASPEYQWDPTPIKRIILYIDDLDRCPPKRVVEVLQAVHLILAFDLFVVVVAVDARWLERSLNESYNPRRQSRDDSSPNHRFNAHNYLEKIFQIPFSLPMMEEDGYQKLVTDMIAAPRRQAERTAQRLAEARRQSETEAVSQIKEDDTGRSLSGRGLSGDGTEKEVNAATDNDQEEKERKRREEEERRKKAEAERLRLERQKANERIKAMLLHDDEEKFIKALHPFIATPRLAKRFLNIYRLIRVSAANHPKVKTFENFIDPKHGEYRAVLVILAIVVGRAEVAHRILNRLNIGKSKTFSTWLKNAPKQNEQSATRMKKENVAQSQKDGASPIREDEENGAADLDEVFGQLRQDVKRVVQALKDLEGPSFDDRIESYRKWALEVGRYSFRWHLSLER